MPDDGGVLENLPRSRPGKRSEKRAGDASRAAGRPADEAAKRPTEATAKAAERAERSDSAAAKPAPGARPRRRRPEPPPPSRSHTDPARDLIRGAAKIAATGARVAGAVAQAVLRRVPRP
jgi:hypothetical protein